MCGWFFEDQLGLPANKGNMNHGTFQPPSKHVPPSSVLFPSEGIPPSMKKATFQIGQWNEKWRKAHRAAEF